MSDGDAAPTLHQRIRGDIEGRILTGAWRPGHRVPSEHELMAEYGCSRMTVNKALSSLAEAGLIVRRRRAGSFVARPHLQSVVLEIPDIQAEVSRRGLAYGYRLLGRRGRAPRRGDADEAALAGGGRLLELDCLHLAGGRPFALEHRLIAVAAAPEAAEADFSEISPGAWLLGHVPWTEAEHRITAVNATEAEAELLGLDPAAACLVLERRTWRGGERITNVRQLFPGDAYDLVARFAPAHG
ncbi:histidine utilization repressor [Phenylobacterium sp.]|uniref:histidine utilization repressor n=1 Tax=Phenylobacterium sp. TaxID=1871053 RepID=UPI0035B4E5F1